MGEKVIEIRHLRKSFGDHEVLNDINFGVEKGEVVSVIGSSGSGKSTMLRCINLLETPTDGEILFHGQNIQSKEVSLKQYRAKVGMVFQQFNLFDNMSVLKNCTVGQIRVLKRSKEEAEKIALDFLGKVGMSQFINARPRQLSGGQKQRVAIARTLAMSPEVILFDEPTSALDPEMVGEVLIKHYGLHYAHEQYYFCWSDITPNHIPKLFEAEGYQIGDSKYKTPSGGPDGEWRKIMGSGGVATINNLTGHGAFVNVTGLDEETYHTGSVRGLILFPDNAIVAVPDGAIITALDNTTDANSLSLIALQSLTQQGCAFFPCAGYYDDAAATRGWGDIAVGGYYWSDTTYQADMAYALSFAYDDTKKTYSFWTYNAFDKKATAYFPIRLIRLPSTN